MFDHKISIIIPVYNKVNSLSRCLDSIVSQSLKEIEVLIYDDCSTDKSAELIDAYAKEHKEIVFVRNKKNIGQGAIRNLGVRRAKGKYILFVDGDDWIDSNACEILFEIAEQNALEILVGKRKKSYGEETNIDIVNLVKNPIVYEGSTIMLKNEFLSVVWDKLWLRDFVIRNNIKATEGSYNDDFQMTIEGLLAAKRVGCLDYVFYFNYIGNRNSITRMIPTEKHLIDKIWVIEFMLNKIKCYSGNKVVPALNKRLVKVIYSGLSQIRRYEGNDQESIESLLSKIKEALSKVGLAILTVRSIPVLNRFLIFISPAVYLKASRIFDRLKVKINNNRSEQVSQ